MARMVNCVKLGREAEGLDFPPYPGPLGKRIYENVSKEAWLVCLCGNGPAERAADYFFARSTASLLDQ